MGIVRERALEPGRRSGNRIKERTRDGTRLTHSCIGPGKNRTYVWQAHAESLREDGSVEPGSAGYWHYHDHCRLREHGTRGIYAGMFGALIVRALNDPVPLWVMRPCFWRTSPI